MSDLIQRLHKIAEDYVKGYELRDDAACHTPNELEHTMLMDCTIGVVDEIVQVVAAEIERTSDRDRLLLAFEHETHQRKSAERQRDEAIAALRTVRAACMRDPLFKAFTEIEFWDAHYLDIVWRHNGEDKRYQADWLKDIWYALRTESARRLLNQKEGT